jgi:hypothetical protein
MQSPKFKMQNAKRKTQNAKRKTQNAKQNSNINSTQRQDEVRLLEIS